MIETSKTTRILVLDDHALFREGLGRLLDSKPDMTVVAQCASVNEAVRALTSLVIDLVLLDFDLGLERGFDFLANVQARDYRGPILVVTAGMSERDAATLLRSGVSGIFLKHNSPESLIKAIRTVMSGESWLDSRYVGILSGLDQGSPSGESPPALTERERAVLRGVFQGLTNKEIACRLNVSEASVKLALQQLFRKTAVRTRGQLVRIALEEYRDEI